MQVSHQADHVTHAVIGGKQSIEFGISNSAEFFNILSSTLYKDQILAVVRETLCNAWDAHIEAGCTDRPVQITLKDNKFTIKDFGKGIHQDDMGLIYGTYGNSTKKNDGKQTGGFGLGCKAPFAYTDHFEVTSCHGGVKTIYSLSKSSAQAMGKPGITPIASFPTEETGLTVSIQIQQNDVGRFETLIKQIVFNGDMHMQLNGNNLKTIEFDMNKGNFLLSKEWLLDSRHRVMIRYGNVIYPVDINAELSGMYNEVSGYLDKLDKQYTKYNIVFQAEPNTISVTPSRESLSMQEHTVNTLKQLLGDFVKSINTTLVTECTKHTTNVTQEAAKKGRIDELLKRTRQLPLLDDWEDVCTIQEWETMAKVYLRNNYPSGVDYRKVDIRNRIEHLIQEGHVDKGKAHTFLLAMQQVTRDTVTARGWSNDPEPSSWLQKRILGPLLTKLSKAGMETNRLYVMDGDDTGWTGYASDAKPPLVTATKVCPRNLLSTISYLRNIVVIASRRDGLLNDAYEHEVFAKAGCYQGFLVYLVGKKKGDAEAARKFFADQGMKIADLTASITVAKPRATPVPRKPAKQGLACLSSLLTSNGVYTSRARRDDAARIDNPEFVIHIPKRSSEYNLDDWNMGTSSLLVELFGSKGGVTLTTAMHTKWLDKGVKDFKEYVSEKVCSYLMDNPRIKEYWAIRPGHVRNDELVRKHVMLSCSRNGLIDLIYLNDDLIKEFGLTNKLTKMDKQYLQLWENIPSRHQYGILPEVIKVKDWLKDIQESPILAKVKAAVVNPLLEGIDITKIACMMGDATNPVLKLKATDLLLTVLKG